jgi:PadR family transcriptional regulator PadR
MPIPVGSELTLGREERTVTFAVRVKNHIVLTTGEDVLAQSLDWVRVSTNESGAGRGPLAPAHADTFALEEFFVLGILREREMYGLEIVRSLSAHPDFAIHSGAGIVYPLLKTLVKEGTLQSRRVNGTPRTYYSLRDQGRERFLTRVKRWASLNDAVQSLAADTRPPA